MWACVLVAVMLWIVKLCFSNRGTQLTMASVIEGDEINEDKEGVAFSTL